MNDFGPLLEKLKPDLPNDAEKYPIGIVGAGSIVRYGHMPAYKKAKFNVRGISSRTISSAKAYHTEFDIPCLFETPLQMAKSDEIKVIDITFPFDEDRMPIIKAAAESGKAILLQKPFAHSLETANEIVAIKRANNAKISVNQNARWAPHYRLIYLLRASGLFGNIYMLEHNMVNNQAHQGWFYDNWYGKSDRFQALEYAIHHIDLLRFWMGEEPTLQRSSYLRRNDLKVNGDIALALILEFDSAIGSIVEDNSAPLSVVPTSNFRVAGDLLSVSGQSMGDNLSFVINTQEEKCELKLDGSWFPDGFIGTMGELMLSIEEDREPSTSIEDNIKSLEIALSIYN